jgi:hypothetical protein
LDDGIGRYLGIGRRDERRLPTASVSTAIHVENFSGYLTCLCQVENSVDNVFYVDDFPHWLECPQRVLGIILVQGCVHDAGGDGVEADTFSCILDCETADHCIQAPPS